jgi:hypothetical protein
MAVTCSSETSVDFRWATRRYVPEDGSLHNHGRENPNFFIAYKVLFLFYSCLPWLDCLMLEWLMNGEFGKPWQRTDGALIQVL